MRGTPDWVIEVLSPSTARKDKGIKRDRYRQTGVKEYWLLHPIDRTLVRYRLEQGAYGLPDVFGAEERIAVPVPEGAQIDLSEVFETAFSEGGTWLRTTNFSERQTNPAFSSVLRRVAANR